MKGYYVECLYLYILKLILNHDFASVKEIPEQPGDVLSHKQVQAERSVVLSAVISPLLHICVVAVIAD